VAWFADWRSSSQCCTGPPCSFSTRFLRRGADLWLAEEIDAPDAVLATSCRVPTLDGEVAVPVEPRTQPGTTLRVAGKGLPRIGSTRGDLYVTLAVGIPEHVTDSDRRLWEGLRHADGTRDYERLRRGILRRSGTEEQFTSCSPDT